MKKTISYIIDLEFSKDLKTLNAQLEDMFELGEEIEKNNVELRKFIASKIEVGIQKLQTISPTQEVEIWEEKLKKIRPTRMQRIFSWWM
jgi:hypothetical protein